MIKQNVFGELYASLFSFRMIIEIDFLKCKGQYLRLIQALEILRKFMIHLLLVTKTFRWLYEIWLGSEVDKILYFFYYISKFHFGKIQPLRLRLWCVMTLAWSCHMQVYPSGNYIPAVILSPNYTSPPFSQHVLW